MTCLGRGIWTLYRCSRDTLSFVLFCDEVVVVVVCYALYEENKSRHVSNIGLQQSLKIYHSGLLLFVVYR